MKRLLLALFMLLALISCTTPANDDQERIAELEERIENLEDALQDVNNNTRYNYEFIEYLVDRIEELENPS